MSEHVTHELLKGFLEAFNRHDLDSIVDISPRTASSTCLEVRHPEVIGVSGRTRCEQACRNDLREFRMCITGKISTGCVVMISESPNGHSPVHLCQGKR